MIKETAFIAEPGCQRLHLILVNYCFKSKKPKLLLVERYQEVTVVKLVCWHYVI